MPHRILDNLSWVENIVHQSASGYALELGDSTVSRLSSEESLIITLAGGSKITVSTPFQLLNNSGTLQIDPWTSAGMEVISQVSKCRVREAVVTPDGTLKLAFDGADAEGPKLIIGPNGWKVYFSNGSGVVGLEGGGIELLPPDHK
jgi:Family of unknown function (DUF6188)